VFGSVSVGGRHIFLSYSREDAAHMHTVKAALERAGVQVWTDAHLQPGTDSWTREIERAIEHAAGVVVVLSPAAKRSPWVDREVRYGQTRGVPVYPVLAEGTEGTAVPLMLISHQYIDLQRHPEQSLARLVEALRTIGAPSQASPRPSRPGLMPSRPGTPWTC
jgi:hypothetical protein